MKLIHKNIPKTLSEIIGNNDAMTRLSHTVKNNGGLGGLSIMIYGKTGSGKTLLANLIAQTADADVYRVKCTQKKQTNDMLEALDSHVSTTSFLTDLSVFIFDEADNLLAENIA